MASSSPVLTIAIPTFNNQEYLLKQIERIVPQLNPYVVFFIIDNCSVPSVKSCVQFQGIKDVKVIENETNIGADANILKCLQLSTTKWTWVLSDNDLVKPDAIQIILDYIRLNGSCSFINFGYQQELRGIGLKAFCESVFYVNSFAISNCLYNTELFRHDIVFYEESILTHQGQLVMVLKHFGLNSSASFIISTKILFDKSLTPHWPKKKFLIDSIKFYKYFPKQTLSTIRNSRFGRQVLGMQIILLSLSRAFENQNRNAALNMLKMLIFNSSIKQIISLQFCKSFLYFLLSFISPQLFRRNTHWLFSESFEIRDDIKKDDTF